MSEKKDSLDLANAAIDIEKRVKTMEVATTRLTLAMTRVERRTSASEEELRSIADGFKKVEKQLTDLLLIFKGLSEKYDKK